MNLQTVTITGADDLTDIQELVDLSAQYPFVEWGILVSKKQEGNYRFPSRNWIDKFCAAVNRKTNVSMHVCGRWVRDMFIGELDWRDLPTVETICQRIQINTHAEPHVSTVGLLKSLNAVKDKEIIFQWDGVNNHLTYAAYGYGFRVAALFDKSGGAGILPDSWPPPSMEFWCGYAGGLGPDNVVDQLHKIAESNNGRYFWIDMERRVRTEDDSALDMAKVRQVLKLTEPYEAGPLF